MATEQDKLNQKTIYLQGRDDWLVSAVQQLAKSERRSFSQQFILLAEKSLKAMGFDENGQAPQA